MKPIPRSLLVCLVVLSACDAPEDLIYVPEVATPVEVGPGVFRVTWNEGPDVVRGVTPDGERIVYRSGAAAGAGGPAVPRILSIAAGGGAATEEAPLYRAALIQHVGNLSFHEGRRLLSVWIPGIPEVHSCLDCPAPPAAVGASFLLLADRDGEALSDLPSLTVPLPTWNSDAGPARNVVRVTPAEQQIRALGVDPYRPVTAPGGTTTYFSDGETVWRYDAAEAGPPDPLVPGAFVALSADGSLLAVSEPVGVDSTMGQCASGFDCQQTTIVMTLSDWVTTIYRTATLELHFGPVAGLEPAFAPDGARVLLRGRGSLRWVDLVSGESTVVDGTDGAFAAAVFPDGSGIAFSSDRFGNSDVFIARQ